MFDHVILRASDVAASARFYRTVLDTLGVAQTHSDESYAEWDDFGVRFAEDHSHVTRGLHIGFVAPSRDHVEAFWEAGRSAGYPDDGEPGPRTQYRYDYYGSFLLDPDGNSAEAVHHGDLSRDGNIDHLWIRSPDVRAAKAFYDAIGPHADVRVGHDAPGHAHFLTGTGSFSVVTGEATENLHVAFGATDDAAVDAFHRAGIAAGYRDNGPPGERLIYHPGYYAAFLLDPDGNNIEVVNHNRG